MSKIGKLPIEMKNGTTLVLEGGEIKVAGPKGNGVFMLPKGINISVDGNIVTVTQEKKGDVVTRPMFGLTRAIVANIVKGVETGFEKKLELVGVGYRAQMQGVDLSLSLGFSHPVKIQPLPGITLSVSESIITVSGTDKAVVGQQAASIRGIKPPEPYKGKGIKYVGEYIKRKAGKAAKAVGGK